MFAIPLAPPIRFIASSVVSSLRVVVSLPGAIAAATILAFFVQPLVAYMPPWSIGVVIYTSLCYMGAVSAVAARDRPHAIAQGLQLAAGAIALIFAFGQASDARNVNDRRCLAIQRDMLSAQPRRDDGPDLFQALGCRPQGEGSVYATPPKRTGAR